MLALIGIMGFGIAGVVVGGVVSVIAVGSSYYMGEQQMAKSEDIENGRQKLQKDAELRAEDRAKAMKLVQQRQAAASLLKTQQSVGGTLLLNDALTLRDQAKAARLLRENKLDHKNYNMGKPAQSV